jgi:hypothetical protein
MAEDTYEGWTNHATWCAYQCLTMDEDTYRTAMRNAQRGVGALRLFGEAYFQQGHWLDNKLPDRCATVHLQAGTSSIDWHEIYTALIESLR